MELKDIIESLNSYAGLFSLLAVVAAIVVPFIIHRIERKSQRQAMKDELEAMQESARFPMTCGEREQYVKMSKLEKGLNRKWTKEPKKKNLFLWKHYPFQKDTATQNHQMLS